MQNIWILNHYATSPEGRHFEFARNLIKRGYNVKIFCASTYHNLNQNKINDSRKHLYEEHSGIPYIYIKTTDYVGNNIKRIKNMFDYALGLLSVSKKFDKDKPDIIYASSVHPLTWLSGYFLAKRYKAKFIAETRDLWPETLVTMGRIKKSNVFAKLLYALEKFIFKNADSLIFTMPGGKEYVENLKIDVSKVNHINNGVDLEEFENNAKEFCFVDNDLQSDFFKVIYTGSMGQANALDYLIRTAEIIQSKGITKIKFLLFGDGYKRKELENYVAENSITNLVFKGRVEKKYVPSILKNSNLNIFTGQNISLYRYGISLNKMFEYFASGKPIISNLECGYDLLQKYNCGVTVPGKSPEALAEGIIKFMEMPQKDYELFAKNAVKAAKDFDYKTLTDKLEKIILDCSDKREVFTKDCKKPVHLEV